MQYRASSILGLVLAASACSAAAPPDPGGDPPAPRDSGGAPGLDAAKVLQVHDAAALGPADAESSTPPPADSGAGGGTQPGAVDAGGAEAPAETPDAAATASFTCNLVIGIKATGEWFNAGFENVVENARWEVVPVHNGHVELWADPMNALWKLAPSSPCAKNAAAPERVIFVGTNYDYTTTAEWVPKLTAAVNNIKAKYPSAGRIELMTYVRAPGNVACPGNLSFKTVIKPAQDEAIDLVAAAFPGLVFVAPKFEVRACSDYSMPPHFTGPAAMAAAKTIGGYYLTH